MMMSLGLSHHATVADLVIYGLFKKKKIKRKKERKKEKEK